MEMTMTNKLRGFKTEFYLPVDGVSVALCIFYVKSIALKEEACLFGCWVQTLTTFLRNELLTFNGSY